MWQQKHKTQKQTEVKKASTSSFFTQNPFTQMAIVLKVKQLKDTQQWVLKLDVQYQSMEKLQSV